MKDRVDKRDKGDEQPPVRRRRAQRTKITPTTERRRVITIAVLADDFRALVERANHEGNTLSWTVASILHDSLTEETERVSA